MSYLNEGVRRCRECNGLVLDDGTVVHCAGECERVSAVDYGTKEVNFHEDVVHELPDFSDVALEELPLDTDQEDESYEN